MRAEEYLGVFRAGHSMMHLCPLWVKYLLLVIVGVVPIFLHVVPVSLGAFFVAALFVLVGARMGLKSLHPGWAFLAMMAVIGIYDSLFRSWQAGIIFICGLISTLWLSRIITTTTPAPVIMDGLAACAKPFRVVGANPEKFALAVTVMWTSIPYLLVSVRTVRDAARARSLRMSWRVVTPVLVSAVGHALQVGEALQARGLGEN